MPATLEARQHMDRDELEAVAKEAVKYMGITGVIGVLIDWSERVFYENMARDIQDMAAEAAAKAAARVNE